LAMAPGRSFFLRALEREGSYHFIHLHYNTLIFVGGICRCDDDSVTISGDAELFEFDQIFCDCFAALECYDE